MEQVILAYHDETFVKVRAEPSIMFELSDRFTFDVPGAKFMPSYKNKVWDGKIRLLNVMSGLIYAGLIPYIQEFCAKRDYECMLVDFPAADSYSHSDITMYLDNLGLPEDREPRWFQHAAFKDAINRDRGLYLSPTASGKSLIIYMLSQFYEGNVLIIVPTTGLVHQMANDFTSYNCDPDNIHKVFSGQEKFTNKKFTITTWQSIYKLPKSWFQKYSVVIGDEAHLFKATSLTSIMGKLGHCRYRFGFTGTLDGTQTNKLVLEGLFGKVYEVTTTSELMKQGYVSDLKIRNIVLKHSEENRKFIKGQTYAQEMDFICTYRPRNIILRNLAIAQKGNTLLLFNYVDKHGKVLDQMIREAVPDRPVFYIHGGVKGEIREEMRQEIATLNNAIIIASYGTLSTGVNIPSIENLIFGSPMKSRIRNLQSIGRSLRLSEGKTFATLYDVSDDLSWKSKSNHTLRHFVDRVKIYNEQNLKYKTYYIEVK